MSTAEVVLVAMLIIFTVPYLVWRLGRTEHYAPLVVVQIVAGIALGPGILGAALPEYDRLAAADGRRQHDADGAGALATGRGRQRRSAAVPGSL